MKPSTAAVGFLLYLEKCDFGLAFLSNPLCLRRRNLEPDFLLIFLYLEKRDLNE